MRTVIYTQEGRVAQACHYWKETVYPGAKERAGGEQPACFNQRPFFPACLKKFCKINFGTNPVLFLCALYLLFSFENQAT
jgi:hypothetical protein